MGQGKSPIGEDVGGLVIDIGSLYVQAGYGGEEGPRHSSFAAAGCPEMSDDKKTFPYYPLFTSAPRAWDVKFCIEGPLNNLEGNADLSNVYDAAKSSRGKELSFNSDVFISIVERIFSPKGILNWSLEGYPVLLSEANIRIPNFEEKTGEILFEHFKAEGYYVAPRACLASLSIGRPSSLVVDIGASSTTICPVLDGYILRRNIKHIPIGGAVLDSYFFHNLGCTHRQVSPRWAWKRSLSKNIDSTTWSINKVEWSGYGIASSSWIRFCSKETLRSIRELYCITGGMTTKMMLMTNNNNSSSSSSNYLLDEPIKIELPDGTIIIGDNSNNNNQYNVMECIFDHTKLNLPTEEKSLQQSVANVINHCDIECRRDMINSILFTGGISKNSGFINRINKELVEGDYLTTKPKSIQINIGRLERQYASWIGGSILSSLSTFQQMWISHAEYEEYGMSSALLRRCLQ